MAMPSGPLSPVGLLEPVFADPLGVEFVGKTPVLLDEPGPLTDLIEIETGFRPGFLPGLVRFEPHIGLLGAEQRHGLSHHIGAPRGGADQVRVNLFRRDAASRGHGEIETRA